MFLFSNLAQRSFCEVYRTTFMLASGERTPHNRTARSSVNHVI